MRRVAAMLFLAALVSARSASAPERGAPPLRPLLGLAIELPKSAGEAMRARALEETRRSGATLLTLTVSWSQCETAPGQFRIGEILRAARLLRQSGATLHLDLPLVSLRLKDVPSDLASTAFDDPRLSTRLGRLLDALEPGLLDASTLSLGYAAETYFSDRPDELRAYRLLFDGAVDFLKKKVPHLRFGVTTAAPTESPAPSVAAALHQRSPVLFYLYAPFEREKPYVHRTPEALDRDWKMLLSSAAGRPIAFCEVSYSSAKENGSSLELQAEFVARLKRFLVASDGSRLLFARYATWRDSPAPSAPPAAASSPVAERRTAFLAHRGLQTERGAPKPAWLQWIKR
ncbi:MAG: hypothetical protein M3R62_14190 [Acidobacteriota bacterium]|nr:hypothetical protein [Acidobacteriota bacterium]